MSVQQIKKSSAWSLVLGVGILALLLGTATAHWLGGGAAILVSLYFLTKV